MIEAPQSPDRIAGRIAPPWHTALLLVLLLGGSLLNVRTHHGTTTPHSRMLLYAVTVVWELLLLAIMYWGIRLRGTTIRQLLGMRRVGVSEWWMDIAIGIGFWFGSSIVLAVVALLLRFAHFDPEAIRRAVMPLAPSTPAELAMWVALSVTAGFCEELIFRGYLQQQFTALTHRVWLGIAIAAVVFGLAHGYEGISGMLLIVLYGALFGILAYSRRSLRAGIFAHAWHDIVSGLVLYFGAHILNRIPH